MQLVELKPNRLTELTQLINVHLHLISQGFTVSEDKVYSVVFENQDPWSLHYDTQSTDWRTQRSDKLL